MRKITLVGAVSCAALLVLAGCASSPRQQQSYAPPPQAGQAASGQADAAQGERKIKGNVPEFVKTAVKTKIEDALVGIGTARMSTLSQSRIYAATRARAEISRQIITFMKDSVGDYIASSELDPETAIAYQENFSRALSQSAMQGASVVDEDQDETGAYWVVVKMPKSGAVREINQAAAQAKLAVPKAAAIDAEKRMNADFDKILGREIEVQDK